MGKVGDRWNAMSSRFARLLPSRRRFSEGPNRLPGYWPSFRKGPTAILFRRYHGTPAGP